MTLKKGFKIVFGILTGVSLLSMPADAYGNDVQPTTDYTVTASGGNAADAANSKSVTDYTYTITPLLPPFNQFFFVETDNPDPLSFRFADKSSIYSEESAIDFNYDTWTKEVILYSDIAYENEETGRVNGGYIFKSFNTDGGELVLQSGEAFGSMGWEVTWEDTDVTLNLPVLKDNVDYLIDTYADQSGFFENMDAVQGGFSSICLYSGSFIRGKLIKPNEYWRVSSSPYKDQGFYIISPYEREDDKALFASAIYPFRYTSLGFPSMMASIAARLDSSSSCKWNSFYHYLIDVTYAGETRLYGGAGTGEGQGIDKEQLIQHFTFGANGTDITLEGAYQLLQDYSAIEVADDIPREDSLTWKKIYDDVGMGSWARVTGSGLVDGSHYTSISPNYAYFYQKGDGTYFNADEWSVGNSNYWGGDLGYACNVWVDGRYVGEWREFVMGETFEDHPTSNILLDQVTIPQIEYQTTYKYNADDDKYETDYVIKNITEQTKNALFVYDEGIWKANYSAFDTNSGCAYYEIIADMTEMGLLDEKYLDMVTLTPEEVNALEVDKNTNTVPMTGYIYDGSSEPGTPYAYLYGDTNCDGKISAVDALKILKIVVGIDFLYDTDRTLADVNADGKISAYDALQVLRYVVGLPVDEKIGYTEY